jgi:drug/metabolite transporter (DMT)-like permease
MSFPSLSREHLGLLLGFVGMAIFGGTLPATRIAVSAIDPIALTALRTAIAGRRPLPPRRLWLQLAIAMLCVSVLFPFLMALAMQTVDASHGGVVLGVLPIATALVAVVITHERPKPLFWIASITGAALVTRAAARFRPATCCCSPRSPPRPLAMLSPGGSPRRCRDGRSSAGCW